MRPRGQLRGGCLAACCAVLVGKEARARSDTSSSASLPVLYSLPFRVAQHVLGHPVQRAALALAALPAGPGGGRLLRPRHRGVWPAHQLACMAGGEARWCCARPWTTRSLLQLRGLQQGITKEQSAAGCSRGRARVAACRKPAASHHPFHAAALPCRSTGRSWRQVALQSVRRWQPWAML